VNGAKPDQNDQPPSKDESLQTSTFGTAGDEDASILDLHGKETSTGVEINASGSSDFRYEGWRTSMASEDESNYSGGNEGSETNPSRDSPTVPSCQNHLKRLEDSHTAADACPKGKDNRRADSPVPIPKRVDGHTCTSECECGCRNESTSSMAVEDGRDTDRNDDVLVQNGDNQANDAPTI
jgi:hypothetical protein